MNDIAVDITIDNYGRLITDTGKNCSINNDWRKTQHFTLPSDTRSVTVKGHNDPGSPGGIIASFNNNVVTDGLWECADMKRCGSFCDNGSYQPAWKRAVTYGRNDNATTIWRKNKDELNKIESNAQWIWVVDSKATNVWCRKTFSKLCPTVNLQTINVLKTLLVILHGPYYFRTTILEDTI